MKKLEEIAGILNIEVNIIESYVEKKWVLPINSESESMFHDVDAARIRLIMDLENFFAIKPDSMDLVLDLIDQIYGLRAYIQKMAHAIDTQPKNIQAEIFTIMSMNEEDGK